MENIQIKEGSIFYSSWGYDQTNIDFYQVVKATAKTVWLRKLNAKVEEKAVVEKTIAEKPVQVQKAAKKRYAIVLASQTMRKNAENFLTVLKEQGVDAQIIDMEGTTKVRVVYGAFETNEEAHEQLQKMRAENSSVFKEAWVLKAFK